MADYRFVDKDPVIDIVRTAYLDSPLTTQQLAAKARVSPTTIDNWFYRDVRRPQNRTLTAVLDALEVDVVYLRRSDGSRVEPPRNLDRQFAQRRKTTR